MLEKRALIMESQEYLRSNPNISLTELLGQYQNPSSFLASLLFAYGFPYVDSSQDDTRVSIFAGYDSGKLDEKITYDPTTNLIYGELNDSIEKVFRVVISLVNDMDSIILLPLEMRKDRIKKIISAIHIDEDFFGMVLRNWL